MKTPTNKTFTTGIRLFAAAMLIAVSGLNAADPEPSIFVTLTNDVGTTIDNSPVPVGQAAIGNGWDYSAAAPVSGTIWNKIAKPATTPTAGGPYTETAPFVINTLNDFQMYDSEGSITSVRLKGVVLGTITSGRSDPRLYNVGGATAKELLNDTWGMYTGDTEAYMLFTFTGLAANTDYILYLYSNVADANQGGKWILHPDNFPAVTTSTFYYPTLPERQTNYVDLSGHTGVVTLFTTGTDGKNRLTPDATINTAAASGDNTLWGTLHAKSTSAGKISFRTATSALGGRRWYTGFQLTPYPEPTIIEQPESEVVGVLDEITEITAIVRDMPYINDIDQNPLTCAWQLSKDDGATWTDIPNPDPSGAYVVSTITESGDVGCVLQIASTKDSDAGIYRLSVTNVAGKTIYSNNAALSVIDEPAPFNFTQQPSPLVAVAGNNVRLSAAVTGTPPFQFVWQKSDTADFTTFQNVQTSVRGPATDNALDFPSIQKSATGHYRVMVTDVRRRASSAIHSDVVYVYVEYAAPVITPPGPQTVVPGNTISLYGGATTDPGAPIHAYQWQVSHDGGVTWTNITDDGTYFGANTSVLTIANAGEAQAGLYRLAADNSITTPHGPEGGITNGDAISLRVGPALVPHPSSVAADRAGNLYVTDDTTNTLYRFTLASGTAVLFAGQSGVAGSADGFYDQATFNGPGGAVAGAANTVFLADTLNHTIRYAQSNGDVRTIAGSPSSSDNVDATGAAAAFTAPVSVSYDAAGNLYVADKVAHTIRRITPVNYDVTTLAGSAGNPGADDGATTDNSLNTIARFTSPGAVAVSPVNLGFSGTTKTITIETPTTNATTLYVADTGNNTIRKIALGWYLDRDPITNVQTRTRISKSDVTTIAGLYGVSGADNGSGADARFNQPSGIAVDRLGAIYVADTGNHVIRKISFVASNTVSVLTIAGTPGVAGYQDGPSDEPHGGINLFNRPTSVSVDDDLNVYVADTGNAAVRMISGVDGSVSTLVFAQGPTPEPSGTSGSGTNGNTDPIDMPPAGHGDGGGAPSLWYLLGLALLGLGRVRTGSLRKHFMKFTSIFCIIGVAAALAFAPSAQAEDAPAVFLKLTRQNESAGAAPTAATTEAIAAPGSGWGYSAAAPYPGTTWNFIKRPADADSRDFTTAIGVYTLNTVNNLALTAPDGTASGVSVTAKLDVTEAQGQRAEPGYGSVTADTVLGPVALMNNNGNWRIYYGSNNTIWEFTGLPADAHYLAYCYAATHTAGQGARFILPADYNPVTTGSVWLETHGGDGTNANVFARVDDIISPRDPAPLAVSSNTAPNINTVWGFFHAKVDAAGKLVLQTAKNAQNGQYPTGFQLIPYPKATITTDLPATTVATLNNSVSFTIVATGFDTDDVLTYQWRKDGVDIPGATGATHTITSAQTSDEGDYDVVVTNYGGDTASTATALTVTTSAIAPSITVQPLPQTALTNGSVSFTVAANGTSPLTYIWQKSVTGAAGAFVDIAGAPNAATLTLADITTADAGHYRVTITNGTAPDAVSTAVPLVVAPVVTTQPVGQITTVGAVTSLSAVFDVGAGAPEATTYAWTFNDAALADGNGVTGAATDTLQFAAFAATNSGYYALTATNSAGSKTTSTVYIGTASSQAVTFAPADQSTGISIDQQLRIVFPSAPRLVAAANSPSTTPRTIPSSPQSTSRNSRPTPHGTWLSPPAPGARCRARNIFINRSRSSATKPG
ncbi:immunoglobulin domain-containing protein [Ereboglobus luteus]|nr:hypothetical protein [Ereboglobus luteus]